jgi:hypothetical protein
MELLDKQLKIFDNAWYGDYMKEYAMKLRKIPTEYIKKWASPADAKFITNSMDTISKNIEAAKLISTNVPRFWKNVKILWKVVDYIDKNKIIVAWWVIGAGVWWMLSPILPWVVAGGATVIWLGNMYKALTSNTSRKKLAEFAKSLAKKAATAQWKDKTIFQDWAQAIRWLLEINIPQSVKDI